MCMICIHVYFDLYIYILVCQVVVFLEFKRMKIVTPDWFHGSSIDSLSMHGICATVVACVFHMS